MLKIEDAKRIEKYYPPNGNGGPKKEYIFKCKTINCDNEIKVKTGKRLITATGLCVKCNNRSFQHKAVAARKLEPHRPLYNRLKDCEKRRNIKVNISFNEFKNLMLIKKCHYCYSDISWEKSHTYNLDRKDNDKSYTLLNVVVCCTRCNRGKRELYSYDDWYGMNKYLRDKHV